MHINWIMEPALIRGFFLAQTESLDGRDDLFGGRIIPLVRLVVVVGRRKDRVGAGFPALARDYHLVTSG